MRRPLTVFLLAALLAAAAVWMVRGARPAAGRASSAPQGLSQAGSAETFQAKLEVDVAMMLGVQKKLERLHVTGIFSSVRVEQTAQSKKLALSLRDAQVSAPDTQTDDAARAGLGELGRELGKVWFASYALDGHLREVAFAPGTHATVQNLLQLIASELQVVARAGSPDWVERESDASGSYLAEYHRAPDDAHTLLKRKRQYLAIQRAARTPIPEVQVRSSAHRYRLDGQGRLLSYEGAEQLALSLADTLRWETSIVLALSDGQYASSTVDAATTAELARAQWRPVGQVDLDEHAQARERDRQLLGELTVAALLVRLDGAKLEQPAERSDLVRLFQAACRLRDADCMTMAEAIARGAKGSEVLLGALGLAATPGAAQALARLARDQKLASDVRAGALRYLSRLSEPSPDTVLLFRSLLDASDPLVREASRFGYGALARQLAASDATRASAIVSDLRARFAAAHDHERIELMRALGNTGASELSALLLPLAVQGATLERREAISALRFVEDEAVDQLLETTILHDAEANTRIAAIATTPFRRFGRLTEALVTAAQHDKEPGVRRAALDALAVHLGELPALHSVFEQSARSDADESVRSLARRQLGTASRP